MKNDTDHPAALIATPDTVYRVSVHNQIYNTKYYVVTEWTRGKRGGYRNTRRVRAGMRGKGNALGLSHGEAVEIAAEWNHEKGWIHGMQIRNSKGSAQFALYA